MVSVPASLSARLSLLVLATSGGTLLLLGGVATAFSLTWVQTGLLVSALTLAATAIVRYASQTYFSHPVHNLAAACREVSAADDYAARVDNSPASGEVSAVVDVINDLLEERQRREHRIGQMREQHDQFVQDEGFRLEKAVVERTQEIRAANDRLQAAADQAVEANHQTHQVIADMTHELRTPLNGVMGMAELLFTTDLSAQQLGYTRTVLESSEDLLALVNNILDFSKVEAGKLERIDSQPFSPQDCVEKVCRLLVARAEMNGLTLSHEGTGDLPTAILGDGKRLRQVLINIIGNAIKFTPQGTVVVRTTLMDQTDDVSTIRFEVVDTGIGIPSHLHEHVFEKFSQVDRSTTRQFGGAGLGLSISKHLVELMGGEIGVVSQPGVGSNFWFTIKGEHRRPATLADMDLRGVQVLVVAAEANPGALEHPLTSCGASAVVVHNADEAVTALDGQAFGAVLIDMPSSDTSSLARQIRAHDRATSLPLVLVSTIERRRDELGEVGIDTWIRKPVKSDELLAVVARVTGRLDVALPDNDRDAVDPDILRALAGARVLVADDHAVNREVTSTLLNTLKCRVDIAMDGMQAVEAVQREAYDLVLLDCEMPKLDGYNAAAQVRQLEQAGQIPASDRYGAREHLPIVAVTAHTSPRDRARSAESGMDDFVSKPFTLQILRGVLTKWLGGGGESAMPPVGTTSSSSRPQSDPAAASPISEEAIAQILELDRLNGGGVFARFARTFLESVPSTLRQLRKAVGEDDAEGIAQSAHALTGASLNIGAEPMAALSGELRALAKEGKTENAASMTDQLEALLEEVKTALEARLADVALEESA